MKVILTADVKGTGKKGELCSVSDGYANNFLLKKNLAIPADASAINVLKTKESATKHHAQVALDEAKAIASKLDGKAVVIKAKAGANGKLFGSITSKELAEELKKNFDIDVNKKKIVLNGDVKNYGDYSFEVKLYQGVSAAMKLKVEE